MNLVRLVLVVAALVAGTATARDPVTIEIDGYLERIEADGASGIVLVAVAEACAGARRLPRACGVRRAHPGI